MLRLAINIVLYITSVVLTILMFIPGFLHAIYSTIRWGGFKTRINYYFLNSAVSIDIMCNSLFDALLNDWFLRKKGYHFGKRGETISSALGKNQCVNGLTWMGIGLASILDLIQKDHCWISIDDEVYHNIYQKPKRPSRWVTASTLLIFIIVFYALCKFLIFII